MSNPPHSLISPRRKTRYPHTDYRKRYQKRMSPTLTSSTSLPRRRAKRRPSLRRLMAWVAASATDRYGASAFVFAFAMIHALLWTVILINLKAAQDVHMDV